MSTLSESIGELIACLIIIPLIVFVLFWIILLLASLEMKDHLEKYHTNKQVIPAKTVVESPATVINKR